MQLKQSSNGLVIYDGPSILDGEPIVAIATLKSKNEKTGNMVQIWILRSDMNPIEASMTNADESICGNCIHRGNRGKQRSCYVNLANAPWQIYNKFDAGEYDVWDGKSDFIKNRYVRLGAYGDPAALPYKICSFIARYSLNWTAYTSQWRTCDQRFKNICMASVKSVDEQKLAKSLGWRTFRNRNESEEILKGEFSCPASKEEGKRLQCINCLACNGTSFNKKEKAGDVVIITHGSPATISSYRNKTMSDHLMTIST